MISLYEVLKKVGYLWLRSTRNPEPSVHPQAAEKKEGGTELCAQTSGPQYVGFRVIGSMSMSIYGRCPKTAVCKFIQT